jgi:hypothetical protein
MRALRLLLVATVLLGAAPASAFDEVTVADLLADPTAYEEVVVVGELIGDYGRRSDAVWTQLNGDSYAEEPILLGGSLTGSNLGIAVRIPNDLFHIARSDLPGGYRHRGPIVRLGGTWKFHDDTRGGESYLDVRRVDLVRHEQPLSEDVRWIPLGIGLGGALVGAGVWRRDRRRAREV